MHGPTVNWSIAPLRMSFSRTNPKSLDQAFHIQPYAKKQDASGASCFLDWKSPPLGIDNQGRGGYNEHEKGAVA